MNQLLILCPQCILNNKRVILGSLDEEGSYRVIIGHNREIRIVGTDFSIFCGVCGELVFFKKGGKEIGDLLNHRIARVFGDSPKAATRVTRIQSSWTTQGTVV